MLEFYEVTFSLFLILDPVGNIPFFLATLKGFSKKKYIKTIIREMCIALFIMIGFHYAGEVLLSFLKVNKATMQIAGGLILFLIALGMVFPALQPQSNSDYPDGDPIIVPLAVPSVAGPSSLVAIILYSHQHSELLLNSAIVSAWFASLLIFLAAAPLQRLLGKKGLIACERLMGLIITLIAVQMFLEGIDTFMQLPPPVLKGG